jgi:hypothetical protein
MTDEKRALKVFLGHGLAEGDEPKVRELYQHLRKCGVQRWLDIEDLISGQDRQEEFEKTLNISDIAITFILKILDRREVQYGKFH